MKILHVSDTPLPDVRIEKMAYTARRKGWETYFVGPPSAGFALGESSFREVLDVVPWNKWARLGIHPHYYWVKRKLAKTIASVKPDLVHAHNIFCAKMISELNIPFVFDDHEFYSMEKKAGIDWKRSALGRC